MLVKLVNGRLVTGSKTLKYSKTLIRKVPQISYVTEDITDEQGEITTVKRKVVTYIDEEYVDNVVVVNPREEDLIDAGYKFFVNNVLEEKEGYYQVPTYIEEDDKIIANYHYEEILNEEI